MISNSTRVARWIDRKKLLKLTVGQKVKIRYMHHPGYINGLPTTKETINDKGDIVLTDEVPLRFSEGPWKDRPFIGIRQQIAHLL